MYCKIIQKPITFSLTRPSARYLCDHTEKCYPEVTRFHSPDSQVHIIIVGGSKNSQRHCQTSSHLKLLANWFSFFSSYVCLWTIRYLEVCFVRREFRVFFARVFQSIPLYVIKPLWLSEFNCFCHIFEVIYLNNDAQKLFQSSMIIISHWYWQISDQSRQFIAIILHHTETLPCDDLYGNQWQLK